MKKILTAFLFSSLVTVGAVHPSMLTRPSYNQNLVRLVPAALISEALMQMPNEGFRQERAAFSLQGGTDLEPFTFTTGRSKAVKRTSDS